MAMVGAQRKEAMVKNGDFFHYDEARILLPNPTLPAITPRVAMGGVT